VTKPPVLPEDGFNAIATCRTGPLLYNRHDQYVGASLQKYGEFSAGETELFRRIVPVGATVIEGGANIGAHTVELSRLVGPQGKVVAFEPQRIVFQTLCANLALNNCANVHAYQCGIGAEPGEIMVPFLPPDRPANFGGLSLSETTEGEETPLWTIDAIGLTACHMIKLDVEGMEVEALKGAVETVRTHRPLMYVENDRVARSAELITLLLSWDYRLYWHRPPLFSPTNFAGNTENIFGNIASHNVLCVPRERDLTVKGAPEITGVRA
jgi:FkbM family methyltransferase